MASLPWPPPPPPLARANAIVGETKPMDATANNAITVVVLQPGEAALARIAQAAQPKGTPQLGEVHPVRRPLLSANQNYATAALSPLRRQNPREEPGALAAHAGICAVCALQAR